MALRLGLVGLGSWGTKILKTVESLRDEARISTIITRDQSFDKWDDIDGLIIATPPDSHVSYAMKAIVHGKPVMIEKPLALNFQEAAELCAVSRQNPGVVTLVNHTHLFAPAYQKLKDLVADQQIIATYSYGCNSGPARNYSSLFDYGPHDLAMILDLVGQIPTNVGCRASDTLSGQLFDIILKFETVSSHAQVGNGGTEKIRQFQVVLENGTSYLYDDVGPSKLSVAGTPFDGWESMHVQHEMPLTLAIKAFIASIKGPEVDIRCGLGLSMHIQDILEQCTKRLNK